MKHFKKANIYKNSTGSNTFHPSKNEAYSYDWWCYFKDFNGVKVFNSYTYSNTTSKHQNSLLSLLDDLGYNVDHFWDIECPEGLQDLKGLDSGIELYKTRIQELIKLINKKGTKRSKNEERSQLIVNYQNKIKMIEKLKEVI